MTEIAPWRPFAVRVRSLDRLSPTFLRVTFTGADLEHFADNGYDQRIKLLFPYPGQSVPVDVDWYAWWRGLSNGQRPPIRTYTAGAVRPGRREVDVAVALHGDGGPASRWAASAAPGDQLVLVGPDARHAGPHGGVEYRPAARARSVLLAGDETAAPAICAILARLPRDARGHALVEVPYSGDRLPVDPPDDVRVTWLARDGAPHGSALVPAVTDVARTVAVTSVPASVRASVHDGPLAEPDDELLWEVPEAGAEAYAWLAGEAGVIRTLRRHLVGDLGWDRKAVAFMGYWRLGHAEAMG